MRHVFLSHIHFDHAGAAWRFAETATVYVHPRGAAHLIDPTKLVESATRIFGDDMERLWGKIAAVPAEHVKILEDNEVVRVPPFEIRAIATPGHASHHHVYHWDDNIFGGDIAGVRIGNGPPIPPFVPPELHIESWRESIRKIRALNATNLYLPHFGKIHGSITEHLDASRVGRNGSVNEFEPVTTNQSFDRRLPSSSTQSYEKEVPLRTTSTVMKRPIRVTWRSAPQSVIGRNIIPTSSAKRLDPLSGQVWRIRILKRISHFADRTLHALENHRSVANRSCEFLSFCTAFAFLGRSKFPSRGRSGNIRTAFSARFSVGEKY